MAEPTRDHLAAEDLGKVGGKLAEFAADAFQDPREKAILLRHVSSAVRRFEHLRGVVIIE